MPNVKNYSRYKNAYKKISDDLLLSNTDNILNDYQNMITAFNSIAFSGYEDDDIQDIYYFELMDKMAKNFMIDNGIKYDIGSCRETALNPTL